MPVPEPEATYRPDAPVCGFCLKGGKKGLLRKSRGRWRCDECGEKSPIRDSDWRRQILQDVEDKVKRSNPLLFGPRIEGFDGRPAEFLYDAWWNVLVGRHDAGIMMMGAVIEGTLQEVLWVQRYEYFRGPLGPLLSYMSAHFVVDFELLAFAEEFRREIRNVWQHIKDHEIVADASVPVAVVKFGGVEQLTQELERVKSGEIPMKRRTSADLPFLRDVLKRMINEQISVPLYNQVWQWAMLMASRYLASRHYSALHRMYDSGPPSVVEWKNGERREVPEALNPPHIQRVLKFAIQDRISPR